MVRDYNEKISITDKDVEVFDFLIEMSGAIRYYKLLYQYPKTIRVDTRHYRAIQEHGEYWAKMNDNNEVIFQNVIVIEDKENKGNFMIIDK